MKQGEAQNALKELIENFAIMVESAKYLAEFQKALYDEYLLAGFTEQQAIELTKGAGK